MENLTGYKDDEWDKNGDYKSTGTVDGEWKLSFPVTVDRSSNITYQVNKEDHGVKVCDVVKTKAGLVLTIETPDFTKKPYNDPYNDPDLAVVDADGKPLQWLYGGIYKQNADGTATYKIMVLYAVFSCSTKRNHTTKAQALSLKPMPSPTMAYAHLPIRTL